MKLFIVIFLALASTIYAGPYGYSSDEIRINSQTNFDNVQKEWKDSIPIDLKSHSQWKSSASSMPGAGPFKLKVTQRILNSNVLRDMPHIQEKLYEIANEKLEKCVSHVRHVLDKSCVGRVTGQIMQLISAVEHI